MLKKSSRLILSICSALILTSMGCSNNLMAPTEPALGNSAGLGVLETDMVSRLTEQGVVNAEGLTKKLKLKKKFGWMSLWERALVNRLTWNFLKQFSDDTVENYFTDPAAKAKIREIVHSESFNQIFFRTGMANLLFKKILNILSESWEPGEGTAPNGFDNPEMTLFPYKYAPRLGFYGDRLVGWQNSVQYDLFSTNALGDTAHVYTKSYPMNLYTNGNLVNHILWKYEFLPSEQSQLAGTCPKLVNLDFSYDVFHHMLTFVYLFDAPNNYTRIEYPGGAIVFNEVWASVLDKSSRVEIFSTNQELNVNLSFDPTGAGGGTVDIFYNGNMYHYVFTVAANGHGFWRLNNGSKHFF